MNSIGCTCRPEWAATGIICTHCEVLQLRTANADLAKRLEEWKKRCESSRPGMKCTECDASQFADTMVEETKAAKDRITELEAELKACQEFAYRGLSEKTTAKFQLGLIYGRAKQALKREG